MAADRGDLVAAESPSSIPEHLTGRSERFRHRSAAIKGGTVSQSA